ncbi:hypothetical protein AX774_g7746 [Zancudomyces culisetae]|uniref:Uncharacterized protein n=1 Tax=Zancudomyces culisetae TaxID=1213189 RepID=A0A1R1PCZ8_ZANCU|nr:hypothetical protein AX774_g7746 [Zancudomyces culisetae]|eukprot:OMH78855.1 hypothetical protein AX774_g7746 [Zancudomyces culisetae]
MVNPVGPMWLYSGICSGNVIKPYEIASSRLNNRPRNTAGMYCNGSSIILIITLLFRLSRSISCSSPTTTLPFPCRSPKTLLFAASSCDPILSVAPYLSPYPLAPASAEQAACLGCCFLFTVLAYIVVVYSSLLVDFPAFHQLIISNFLLVVFFQCIFEHTCYHSAGVSLLAALKSFIFSSPTHSLFIKVFYLYTVLFLLLVGYWLYICWEWCLF